MAALAGRVASWRGPVTGVVAAVAAALIAGSAAVRAHEIGTTRVSVLLDADRRYEIELVTDAAALVEKLEAAAGRAPGSGDDPARQQAMLATLDELFRRRLTASFDGTAIHPAIVYAVASPVDALSAAVATVHLSGEIPPGARTFTWSYAWTFASYALTVRSGPSGVPATEWLEGGQASTPFVVSGAAPSTGRPADAWRYFALGFTHILPGGLDHVLFVLALFLLSGRVRSVLWQVSAFTVAHSITLGLSMYDLVAVPASLAEPLIALSIAYVAVENVFQSELRPSRVGLVFMFGLLHGMGFAGALKDVGLGQADFLTALLTFNLGVEAGQCAVVGAAFLLLWAPFRRRGWYRRAIVVPASLLIACTALYWTIQRVGAWS